MISIGTYTDLSVDVDGVTAFVELVVVTTLVEEASVVIVVVVVKVVGR